MNLVKKKILTVVLSLVMVLTMVPVTGVSAATNKTTVTTKTTKTKVVWKKYTKMPKGWYSINNPFYKVEVPKEKRKKGNIKFKMTSSALYIYGSVKNRQKKVYFVKPMKLKFTKNCKFYLYKYSDGNDQCYVQISKKKAKKYFNKYKAGGAYYNNRLRVKGIEDEYPITLLDEIHVKSSGKINKVYLWWK